MIEGNIYLRRVCAFLIDILAIGVLQFVSSLFCIALLEWISARDLSAFLQSTNAEYCGFALGLLCFFTYFSLSYWYTNGASLGKRICGLRVIGSNAELRFSQALLRSLCYPLGYFTFSLGFLLPLFRKDGKALHDILGRTRVISV